MNKPETKTTTLCEIKAKIKCFVESDDGKTKLHLASARAFETSRCVLNDAKVTDEQLKMRITI